MSSPASLPQEIYLSVEQGELPKVVKWLRKGGAVDALCPTTTRGGLPITTTLLHAAALNEHLAIVKELLKRGASVDLPSSLGWTALMGAAGYGNLPIAYLLTNPHCQANPNQLDLGPHNANRAFPRSMARENTVLHCLVLHDQKEMYRTLVDEYGANPWAPNIHGDTPLLLACRRSLEMAQVIILES